MVEPVRSQQRHLCLGGSLTLILISSPRIGMRICPCTCAGSVEEQLADMASIFACLDDAPPPATRNASSSNATSDPFESSLPGLLDHRQPSSNIACCLEYHRLYEAMQDAGYTSFPSPPPSLPHNPLAGPASGLCIPPFALRLPFCNALISSPSYL